MRMKLKNLKKLISVAIICTMITALFVPTLSVQAAETQEIQNVIENYTDIENSPYVINDVEIYYSSVYVHYSAPKECKIILAEYDGLKGYLKEFYTNNVSESTDSSSYFYLNSYGNRCSIIKAFIVDFNNRPLGKSFTKNLEITGESEAPSFGYEYDMEPHPTAPLKNDSGKFSYGIDWSVNTDGVLSLDGGYTYLYTTGNNTAPWNEYRESITKVYAPDDMSEISPFMFQGLSKVKEIAVPAQAYVNGSSYIDMPSLETVTLSYYYDNEDGCSYSPSGVNGDTFRNCPSIKEFIVHNNDEQYTTIDGVLYSKDLKTLIKYPAGKTDKTFTVPDSVTAISSYAFECAANLESVYNVKDLNSSHIFANCTSLKNIEISSEIKYININAFCNCESLTNLILPDNISYVSDYVDWGDYNCDDCCTLGTTSLESINIPSKLKPEDAYAFVSALPESVKNIDLKADDSNFKLVDGVLYSTDMTRLFKYLGSSDRTSFTVPESVTSIENCAFRNCKNLKNIEIGSNVESIGLNAFEGCANLTDITLLNVSDISSEAFKNCINLNNVELGSVKTIESNAFDGCKSLVSITIPAGVRNIYQGVFVNCDSLEEIIVDEGNTKYSTFDGCLYQDQTLMEYPNAKAENYVVSSYTTAIASKAFEGRNSLKSVVIPDSVTRIDNYAFSDCGNLTTVSLPVGIDTIESYTFNNCTSLSKINIPESLYTIYYFAFANCKSLKSIDFPKTLQNDTLYVYSRAFYNCGLESVTIPEYVHLDYVPFFNCYNLKSVKFKGDFSANYYMSQVFWNVDDLTIYYPEGNKNWDSSLIHNYQHQDSLKFVPYKDSNKNYNGSYTFTGLEPNTTYVVGVNNGNVNSDFLSISSFIYFDQLNSDSKGNITISYKTNDSTEKAVPFVLGTAKYDISNASIEISEMVYTGKEQDKPDNYTVTSDGKELTEGVDYLVLDGSGFVYAGICSFSIVGIGNYYGEASQEYTVFSTDFDVDGDDMISISDVTAIQLYLAGIREITYKYGHEAADVNGDGEITVEDATYLQKLLASIC